MVKRAQASNQNLRRALYFFGLLLIFDAWGIIALVDFGVTARPISIISALLFGSLSLAALGALFFDHFMEGRKVDLLSERREIRQKEANDQLAKHRKAALKRLDSSGKKKCIILLLASGKTNKRSQRGRIVVVWLT